MERVSIDGVLSGDQPRGHDNPDTIGRVSIDGVLCHRETHRATIPVSDHAITVGDGVFETLQVVGGVAFALTRHLDRLRRSADLIGLGSLPDSDTLRGWVNEILDDGPSTGRLRLTVTAGDGPLSSARGEGPPRTIMATSALPVRRPESRLHTVPWTRNERGALVGAKTTSYAENVVALAAAARNGADEALLLNNRGEICEGTGSNIFVVLGGRIHTPPLSSGCLAGITRELVGELLPVEERVLTAVDLDRADEVFITSSTRDVQPVASVDGRLYPGRNGPVTARAQALFSDLMATRPDP